MLYMSSTSSSNGQLTLTVYFTLDTDPDIAQVQVQNRVNLALPQLPDGRHAAGRLGAEEVLLDHDADRRLRQGRSATAATTSPTTRTSTSSTRSSGCRAPGRRSIMGVPDQAMRIWMNPDRMASLGITTSDIQQAVAEPERPLRGRPDRPAAHGGPGAADVPGRHPAPVHRARRVREHHPPRQPGRERHRPPEGRGAGRGGPAAVHRRQQAQRRSRPPSSPSTSSPAPTASQVSKAVRKTLGGDEGPLPRRASTT